MRSLMIAAALSLVAVVPVQAQDAEAHKPEAPKTVCHGADGKAAPCVQKTARGGSKAKAATSMISRCRDVTTHQLTKCGGRNAEPVPAN